MNILLIIDMQNAWLKRAAAPCFQLDAVVTRINHAAQQIRQQGGQVIFVRHQDEEAEMNSEGWQIIPELVQVPSDAYVEKRYCDGFIDTTLAANLVACETLYVCGFATEFCVDTTVRAGAGRGYNLTVLADAHTTSNRPNLDAASIIAHHNWVWKHMSSPSKTGIVLKNTAELFPG